MIDQAKKILKTVFGYDEFISLQEDVIENILRKNDTLWYQRLRIQPKISKREIKALMKDVWKKTLDSIFFKG